MIPKKDIESYAHICKHLRATTRYANNYGHGKYIRCWICNLDNMKIYALNHCEKFCRYRSV